MRQSWETITSVSAGHIILTPTQPVGSGRPQRGSNPGPPHQESRALPTELPRPPYCHVVAGLARLDDDLIVGSLWRLSYCDSVNRTRMRCLHFTFDLDFFRFFSATERTRYSTMLGISRTEHSLLYGECCLTSADDISKSP